MTEMQVRQKIVGVMQGWVGRKEANGTHKEIIDIYSHNGYQKAQSADYDNERAAQKLIQELSAK